MTMLLEKALSKLKELPEEQQDIAATLVLDFVDTHASGYVLTDAQLAEVELSLQEAREGKFATDEEVAALWKKFGL